METIAKPKITIDEFSEISSKLSIQIGEIISAERIPKSNGLKLTVMFGHLPEDVKTSFTSLGKTFEPDVFVGKKCPFIMNLESTVIKGVNSEVMIMVGEHEYLGGIDLDNYRVGAKLM